MSRGTETIETLSATGSSDATIIVSVDAVLRSGPESIPSSMIVVRRCVIPGLGDAEAPAEGEALAPGRSGSSKIGNGAVTDGEKILASSWRTRLV